MFKPAIILCSRLDSERLPNKVLREINGVPILIHLLRQLTPLKIPIILAVPNDQRGTYDDALFDCKDLDGVELFSSSHDTDPLARMADIVTDRDITHVVRITHDKIFVDTENLSAALKLVEGSKIDYAYSSQLHPGTGFEIISAQCVLDASAKFKDVEHISYAARIVSKNSVNIEIKQTKIPHNLLIDFPEDLRLMEVIFSALGNDITWKEVSEYLKQPTQADLAYINLPPVVSVYICAHNAEKFLKKALNSVVCQTMFQDYGELILIDDCSADSTCEIMAKFSAGRPNVSWYRNAQNKGLAASSNIALSKARGKFLIRLDADDFFTDDGVLLQMLEYAQRHSHEVIYPDNYFGSFDKIQKGRECHHAGGALFDRRALNFLKFNGQLRNYEGLDLFVRAKDTLKIGYFEKPCFFYTQHETSMSKTNLEERAKVKKEIESRAI